MSTTNEVTTETIFAGQVRPGDVIHEDHPPTKQTVWMTSHGPTPEIHYTDSDGDDGTRQTAEWWVFEVSSPRNVAPANFDIR